MVSIAVFENVCLADFRFRIRKRRNVSRVSFGADGPEMDLRVVWQVLDGDRVVSTHRTEKGAEDWIVQQIPEGKRRQDYIAIRAADQFTASAQASPSRRDSDSGEP